MTDRPHDAIAGAAAAGSPPLPFVTAIDAPRGSIVCSVDDRCRRYPGIALDGAPFCARHAGARLLSLLLERGGR